MVCVILKKNHKIINEISVITMELDKLIEKRKTNTPLTCTRRLNDIT